MQHIMRAGGIIMLFYRVTAMLDDEKWVEENNDRRIKRDHNRRITRKSEDYNERIKILRGE